MFAEMMPALVWTAPGQMVVRDEPVPIPGAGDVLIRTEAVGICGSELSGYLGQNALRKPPLIMGHEAAGVIVRAGAGRLANGTPPAEGQAVTFNPLVTCGACDFCRAARSNLCRERKVVSAHLPGAFARYVAVPARNCRALPPGLSTVAASLTEPLACAVRCIELAESPTPAARWLILGAGPIGLFCLAIARRAGAVDPVVVDRSETRLDIARAWGAGHALNPSRADLAQTLRGLCPEGFEIVIDAVGATATRQLAVQTVAPGGTIVLVGLHEETSALPANALVRFEITLRGAFAYTEQNFDQALDLLGRGVVRPDPSWLEERPLDQGAAAFAELVEGRCPRAKIVLRLDG